MESSVSGGRLGVECGIAVFDHASDERHGEWSRQVIAGGVLYGGPGPAPLRWVRLTADPIMCLKVRVKILKYDFQYIYFRGCINK